jgi:hypothetical protein
MAVEPEVFSSSLNRPRRDGRLQLLLIPLLGAAFGAVSGVTVNVILPTAIFGLVWGVFIAILAPGLARFGARPSAWSELTLLVSVSLAFIVLGGALLGDTMAATPRDQLQILQYSRFGMFFAIIHVLFELILLPLVIALNWHRQSRRRLVVAAAIAFYLGRVASAVYFAPNAIAWGSDPNLATLNEVQIWMNLNWVRTLGQDAVTAILLLLAAVQPGPRSTSAAFARTIGVAPS